MKKKIAAITFHSSYNYGSVLQAYALQEFVKKEFGKYFDYKIINLRTDRQKEFYKRPYGYYDCRSLARKCLFVGFKNKILGKKYKFEKFINNSLNITSEYSDVYEIEKAKLKFDYYISGSDQIWNYAILDFDWSFFLEFCEKGKKISYAASFGPKPLELDEATKNRLEKDLSEYENISVREVGSAEKVKQIMDMDIAEIHVDPTLLLDKKDWDKIAGARIIKGDYIFLYDLKGNRNAYEIARKLSKTYDVPVVIVKENAKMNILYRDFIKKYDAGPLEFLNYIKYAKIVVSSSFHGNAFSVIFEKPFLAVGGKEDFRINNLLKMTGLIGRAVTTIDDIMPGKELFDVNFDFAKRAVKKEQKRSRKYLAKALEVGEK